MKATMRLTDPDEVEATLSLTLKMREWKRLQDDLGIYHPSDSLRRVIGEMVAKAADKLSETTGDPE